MSPRHSLAGVEDEADLLQTQDLGSGVEPGAGHDGQMAGQVFGELGRGGMGIVLKGRDPELIELLSNDRHVTSRTPPAFLVHAWDDEVVPVTVPPKFSVVEQDDGPRG